MRARSVCCVKCVPQAYGGVIESVGGQFSEIVPPGCHVINPCSRKLAGLVSFKTEIINCEMQTVSGDQATVFIKVSILYRVIPSESHRAYYSTSRTADQIRSFVVSSLRSILPTKSLDDIFTERQEIIHHIQEHLRPTLRGLGFEIVDVLLTDIEIRGAIKQAMSQQATQRYARLATQYQAEGQRTIAIGISEAEAEASRLRGIGTAAARSAIANAFREGMQEGGNKASEAELTALILMIQYFDMMNDVAHSRPVKPASYFVPCNDLRRGVEREQMRERVKTIIQQSRAKAADGDI